MKLLSALMAGVTAFALITPAFAADTTPKTTREYNAHGNGGYDAKTSSKIVTHAGTEKTSENTTDVDIDDNGDTTRTTKTKSVNDAEGLMNRKKNVTETKVKKMKDGYAVKKSNMKSDNAGTDVSTKSKTKVSVDAKGNVKTTTETEKEVDPKGLFNSHTEKSTAKTVNGKVVK